MNNINITELSTELPDVTDSPARPESPEVGELHTPDDLRPLHRQLIAQATELAGHGDDAGKWTAAAAKVSNLWNAWRNRMHATAAYDAMREAAGQTVHAVIEGLRHGGDWQEAHRWFNVADGWINDLRMQAESDRVGLLAPPRRPERLSRRVLAGLFGRPR